MDNLILVNIMDEPVGKAGKFEAHAGSMLHRAFSVFLYHKNKLLIQKRAEGKYHSAGLWANTCCSHPRTDETLEAAVSRRLLEEVGIEYDMSIMEHLTSFIYREDFGDLAEYELDHIFVGPYNGIFEPAPEEIDEMKWEDIDVIAEEMRLQPQRFAAWFITAFPIVYKFIKSKTDNE